MRRLRLFGGDPENVTIFGQSGGGAKVSRADGDAAGTRTAAQGDRAERLAVWMG